MQNPFKKPAPDEQKPPAGTVRDQLDALRSAEPAMIRAYDEAALAAIDGGDQTAADRAYAALAAHRQAITRAEGVLQAVDRRGERQQADAAAKARDDAWIRTEGHAKRRIAIAQRLAAIFKQAGEEAAEFVSCTTEMHRALPGGYPTHRTYSFGISPNFVSDMIRVEYARNGLPGSGIALEGKTPKPLDQHCSETVQCISEARALSKAAA
jgi:hypothetical protein